MKAYKDGIITVDMDTRTDFTFILQVGSDLWESFSFNIRHSKTHKRCSAKITM